MESTGQKHATKSRSSGLLASLDLIAKASAQLLHPASDLKAILPTILEIAQSLVAADAYAVWRACPDQSWEIIASAGLSETYQSHRIGASAHAIPRQTVAIADVLQHEMVEARRQLYRKENISSLMVSPLVVSDAVVGTLTFYFRNRHTSSDEEMHLATALANLTASAIATSRLHEEQLRSRQQSDFLAGASAVLASSMNYEVTLATVTQLAVPRIADWCAIDLLENGELHRVGIAHRDPAKLELAREYRKLYPPDMSSGSGVGAVVRTGQPQFFPHISDDVMASQSHDERHRKMLEELGLQSFLITPLKIRDRVLGALTLVCAGRDMDFADCQLADQLAQRAAIAIDNAKLFGASQRSENELRLITDILPVLVAYIDSEEKYLRVNQAFELWFGRTKEQVVGQTVQQVLGANYARLEGNIKRALRGELVQYEATNEYADKRRHVFITYVPDFDEQHRVRGFAALVQDVTERRAAEDALRKTEKLAAVGRLAASISHEINNPLEAVTNLVYLARNAPELSESTKSFLNTAERELARVSQIASQTLRFYRQSSRPVQVNLCEVVDSVLRVYEGRIANSQLQIRRDYGAQVISIEAIDGELRQVLANLIGNAIDATPAGGNIRIRISDSPLPRENRHVRVTIADNGCGISPQVLPRLFEPFFTTKTETGTGLGLWITREILTKHHARIRVRSSQTAGRSGTAFTIFLPSSSKEAA
jgi:PAS domain S-box-containing protein